MNTPLKSPGSTTSPSKLADWIELKALHGDDRNASTQDLVAELRRDGSMDALPVEEDIHKLTDFGGEVTEVIVNDAFSEIEDRSIAAGPGYPFIVEDQYIELKPSMNIDNSTYLFLLVLSYFGSGAGEPVRIRPERDFEDISIEAAKNYLGCNPHDGSYLLAFPRRTKEKDFHAAVDKLSQLLHEGEGSRHSSISKHKKDAGLDLVVWHGFVDQKPGQLIAFGQCTTAKDWRGKVNSLPRPLDWCRLWMLDAPAVSPIRMLFIPHIPDNDQWREASILGGVLFDRCRISYHAPNYPGAVASCCTRWVEFVLKEYVYARR